MRGLIATPALLLLLVWAPYGEASLVAQRRLSGKDSHNQRKKNPLGASSSSVCQATACFACTAINYGTVEGHLDPVGCGWCNSTNTCVLGTKKGSIDANCGSHHYNWGYQPAACGAPPPTPAPGHINSCGGHTDCGSCVADKAGRGGGCGWCAASSSCAFGTSAGPLSGSCSTWDWEATNCPGGSSTPTPGGGPAPAGELPFIPVNPSSRTWSGRGGDDLYNSFYTPETVGKSILPRQRWSKNFASKSILIYNNSLASAGDVLVAGKCTWNNGFPIWALDSLNVTTGDVVGSTTLSSCDYAKGEAMTTPGIDGSKLIAYVVTGNLVSAIQLPTASNGYTQSVIWNSTLSGNGQNLMLQLTLGQIQLTTHTSEGETSYLLINTTNGDNIIPPTSLTQSDPVVPKLVALSATNTMAVFESRFAQLSSFYGAVLWKSTMPNMDLVFPISAAKDMNLLFVRGQASIYNATRLPVVALNTSTSALNVAYNIEGCENVLGHDDTVFWCVSGLVDGGKGRLITEYNLADGTPRTGNYFYVFNYRRLPQEGGFVATKDWIFAAAVSEEAGDGLEILMWPRGGNALPLLWTIPLSSPFDHHNVGPNAMIYRGGWLFISVQWEIFGIQVVV